MNCIFYIVYSLLLATGIILYFVNERVWKKDLSKVAKILVFVLAAAFFVNIFLPDLFAWRGLPASRTGVVGGKADYNLAPSEEWINAFKDANGKTHLNEIIHTLARVGFAIGPVSIPFAICFKKTNIARVVSFIVLPFSILSAVLYFQYIKYFTSPLAPSVFGEGSRVVLQNYAFRSVWFGLLNLLQTLLAFYVVMKYKGELKFKGKKDVLLFLGIALAFVFTNMPIYTAQHLFHSYSKVILTIAYPGHFLFMAGLIAEAVILYFIFRNKSNEDKYVLFFIMALSLLYQYNTFFKTDGVINASRWPFQLCNIAGAFIIATLLTKSAKMFHFTLVVNTLGAIIAIAICDSTFNTGIFYCMNIHYMVEHGNVLLVPLLAGILKLFPPLKKSDVKHVIIGFAIYWAFILVIGTILCSFQTGEPGDFFGGVNYLFMFNRDASVKLIGFVDPLFKASVSIGKAKLYLVQPVVLIAFEALCTGLFFLFYACFKEKKHA